MPYKATTTTITHSIQSDHASQICAAVFQLVQCVVFIQYKISQILRPLLLRFRACELASNTWAARSVAFSALNYAERGP